MGKGCSGCGPHCFIKLFDTCATHPSIATAPKSHMAALLVFPVWMYLQQNFLIPVYSVAIAVTYVPGYADKEKLFKRLFDIIKKVILI